MNVKELTGWRGTLQNVEDAKTLATANAEWHESAPNGIKGIWETTNEVYHQGPGVSKSDLDLIERAPVLYRDKNLTPRKSTDSMDLGTAVHALVLEPEKWDAEFAVCPACDRRTTVGKATYADFLKTAGGKKVIDNETFKKAMGMADAVKNHPTAGPLFKGGIAEYSFFTKHKETWVKCRPDYLTKIPDINKLFITDLKTSSAGSPDDWKRSARNYRYHVQAALYSDIVHDVTGFPVHNFRFVVVESSEPYLVAVYEISLESMQEGRYAYKRNLGKLAHCEIHNDWPGYPLAITTITI